MKKVYHRDKKKRLFTASIISTTKNPPRNILNISKNLIFKPIHFFRYLRTNIVPIIDAMMTEMAAPTIPRMGIKPK